MHKNNIKEFEQFMFRCKRDVELKASQRQFIDPALIQLKKHNISEYNQLIKKYNWKIFIF